ncbi:MAG: hypothetical protein JF887_00715 [Candidatus Dormibacteraeota bacterium]|uniref:Uncharacterized protein n=1 Tax=Candidatus Amunia macphersoniae TaxID=3127014 RepID=A0A934NFD0_9BACT|nr:hypothetical protein [Candidatus Dormibacteraeota bacterium]
MASIDGVNGVAERSSPLVGAAHRLVGRIEALVDEVAKLRVDNAALRIEMREAVALLDAAAATVPNGQRPSRGRKPGASKPTTASRRRRRGAAPKGRATPTDVTADVVRAVLVKLGEATAAQVAAEITRARVQAGVAGSTPPVGGRAVRFLAERAGATARVGEDGQRRYRLG